MPVSPKWVGDAGMNFILNYIRAGCDLSAFLVIDVNSEAQKDLFLLLLVPDLEDLVQEIFDPRNGRKRSKERHGRKRPRGPGFPDISTLMGRAAVGEVDIIKGARLSPLRYVFPIWNLYEGISFTAALVQGIEGVTYERLLAILEVNPNQCQEVPRLWRIASTPITSGGAGCVPCSLPMGTLKAASGFAESGFNASCAVPWQFNISAEIRRLSGGTVGGYFCMGPIGDRCRLRSPTITLSDDGWTSAGFSGAVPENIFYEWGWHNDPGGFVEMRNLQIFGAAREIRFLV